MNPKKRSKNLPFSTTVITLVILLIGSAAFGGYYFKQYRDLKVASTKTPDQINEELVKQVRQVFELPDGEKPVVALVSDEATFKKEYPVFTAAQKGDNLLLYQNAGQAVLYRPSAKKVVGTAAFAVKKTANIALIAGAEEQVSIEKIVNDKFSTDLKVATKTLPLGTYAAVTVIDVSGKQSALAIALAAALGGTVSSSLPVVEKVPEGTELVVIAGSVVKPADSPTTP